MDRRGFFKSLALLGAAAAVAPGVFVPKFEPVHWKVARPTRWGINPKWVTAQYEIRFVDMPTMLDRRIIESDCRDGCLPYPQPRFEYNSDTGGFDQVFPYVSV